MRLVLLLLLSMTMPYSNVFKKSVRLATSGIKINLNALLSHNPALNNKSIISQANLVLTNVKRIILISLLTIAARACLKFLSMTPLLKNVLSLNARMVLNGIKISKNVVLLIKNAKYGKLMAFKLKNVLISVRLISPTTSRLMDVFVLYLNQYLMQHQESVRTHPALKALNGTLSW